MHRRSDYHFELPPRQIAQHPADQRDASRLLVVGPAGGLGAHALADRAFTDLPALVPDDAIVIVNDTRVIPARVRTHKHVPAGTAPGQGGGAVEVLFVEPAFAPTAATSAPTATTSARAAAAPASPARAAATPASPAELPAGHTAWRCLVRPQKSLRAGTILVPDAAPHTRLTVVDPRLADGAALVAVPGTAADLHAFLDAAGELPLPPYIAHPAGAADRARYQTVFARDPGAIAAPTAGLHFTPAVLDALAARGATLATVTLHVGLGTFAPVRDDDLAAHVMHRERYDVPAATAALIATGRPVVAVGTTVVRTLESAALGARRVAAGPGDTALFIRPGAGFTFQVVDHLVTNFHLPESTLLMLVSAFAGFDRIRAAYAHAVAAGYRFFSYGDAMLLTRSAA